VKASAMSFSLQLACHPSDSFPQNQDIAVTLPLGEAGSEDLFTSIYICLSIEMEHMFI
jgi:hypothetical protein